MLPAMPMTKFTKRVINIYFKNAVPALKYKNRRNFFSIFILFIFWTPAYSQPHDNIDSAKSKVYIIGVVHTENEKRNVDSLLRILNDIRPDLILAETDTLSGYFNPDYTLAEPPRWYKIGRRLNLGRKMPPEMDLLYQYRAINNSVLIYPFDIAIKKRKNYVASTKKSESQWISSLNAASGNNQIPDSILSFHKEYIGFNNWFFEMSRQSYYFMNRTVVTDSIRQMMALEKKYFPRLINSVQQLSAYKSWYIESIRYWDLRNQVMSKNIIAFIEKSASKNVVVFTGLLHKYYLIDLLNSYNSQAKYKIVEYFDK
jgi:hypothetical protein